MRSGLARAWMPRDGAGVADVGEIESDCAMGGVCL